MRKTQLAAFTAIVLAGGVALADMTEGAVPAAQIKPLVPEKLAGIEPSHALDYPWAVANAYQLPEGGYANLDIQNTFHRGSHNTSLEDMNNSNASLCPKKERINGYVACVKVAAKSDGGTAIRWYLPDRLTVRIAAPTEELARKMAADLPIGKLAALSARKKP